jgi:hypothetical protein
MRQALIFNTVQSTFDIEAPPEGEAKAFDLFWKESIPQGVWKHPVRGFTLNVTKDRMQGWVDNFYNKQKPHNINVPVPYGHTYTPEQNAGFVQEMEVRQKPDGKYALFTLQAIPRGEDSSRINTTIKGVSVSIHPNVKHSMPDGTVAEFGECVEHVALTNYAVIPGQSDFVAFDQAGEAVAAVYLDMVADVPTEGTDYNGYVLDRKQLLDLVQDLMQTAPRSEDKLSKGLEIGAARTILNDPAWVDVCAALSFGTPEERQRSISSVEEYWLANDTLEGAFRVLHFGMAHQSDNDPALTELTGKAFDRGQLLLREKGSDMLLTGPQLRSLEAKFSLETGSLTTENWFDKVQAIEFAKPMPTKDGEEEDDEGEGKGKGKGKSTFPAFDITSSPEFVALRAQNHGLLLDRNRSRLSNIAQRTEAAMKSGRMNKAAYDKMLPKTEALQFSNETSVGQEWDSWADRVEHQLSIIESLPEGHTVSTTRQTNDHNHVVLDQQNNDDQKKEFDELDSIIKKAVPQFHMDSVVQDPRTGLFVSRPQ